MASDSSTASEGGIARWRRTAVRVSDPDRLAELGSVPSWFAVLPDCLAASAAHAVLGARATNEITHPSGRPWLVGRWPEDAVTAGQAGHAKVVLIGQHATTSAHLQAAAGRLHTPADLDQVAGSLVGSSHLFASVAGQARVQGTVTGIRRVFTARVDGVSVAADRADLLAALLGSSLDEQRLALHLLQPAIIYPLAGQPVWRGVEELPTDHYLVLDSTGRSRSVRWWSPPKPVVPLAEGARALREALSAAVGARTRDRTVVSCDLGGVDSTALVSLAARGPAKTLAFTAESLDPRADDASWAVETITTLMGASLTGIEGHQRDRNVEHVVLPADQMPLVFHGLLDDTDVLDEPCAAAVDRNRWLTIAYQAAKHGSGMHLTGFGGDELFYGSLAHLHPLLRSDPVTALRSLRGFAAKYRWRWRDVLRQLRDTSPYAGWLRRAADRLTSAPAPPETPLLDWGFHPRLPPWVSADAAEAVRELLRHAAHEAQPLTANRGQHRELETMRFVSRTARQLDQMAGAMGVSLAAPYYDDRVIEAALSVRPQERISPWDCKPLLAEAMRGIVPDAALTRSTKANRTCDEDPGLRQHRGDLLGLCADSRLAQLGLVDLAALREVCSQPVSAAHQVGELYGTVACETWLRSRKSWAGGKSWASQGSTAVPRQRR